MVTKLTTMLNRVKSWVLSNKKHTIIIGTVLIAVIVAIIIILICVNTTTIGSRGYQDVLDQLNAGTYTDPIDGEFTANTQGWIVHLQPITTAEESIQNIAKAGSAYNTVLFIGHNVNKDAKNITYAFVCLDDDGNKYVLYAIQTSNNTITFETADYSEVEGIFFSENNGRLDEVETDSESNDASSKTLDDIIGLNARVLSEVV